MKRIKSITLLAIILTAWATTAHAQKELPDFVFTDLEGNAFTRSHLQGDLPTIAIFFDPYCDHCDQQAEWITEAASRFEEVQMIWVTTEEQAPSVDFRKRHFDNTSLKHVYILRDTEFMFDGYFGYSEVPSIYLFNKAGKRVKSFTKETPADVLLKFL